MTKKYKLLIFDWDGTLMDSAGCIIDCVCKTAKDLGLELPNRSLIREGIGLGFLDLIKQLFPQADPQTFKQCYEGHYYEAEQGFPHLFEGTQTLLKALKDQAYLLAVATSMQSNLLSDLLSHYHMQDLFNATRCSDQTLGKPHPQMIFEILNDLKVAPKDALMIGDSEYDMYMAKNADIDRIAVTYGVHTMEQLSAHGPIACIDTLQDLWDYI